MEPDIQSRTCGGAARIVAAIAGAFLLVAGAIVLQTRQQLVQARPLDSRALAEAREALHQAPTDPARLDAVRVLDRDTRSEFLALEARLDRGRFVLLLSAIVCLIALRAAVPWRPAAPGAPPAEAAAWARAAARTQVALLMVAIGGVCVGVVLLSRLPAVKVGASAPASPAVAAEVARGMDSETWMAAWLTNWPAFRGPRGDGVVRAGRMPLQWTPEGRNVRWRTPIPLPGNSSPIVWGARVYITGSDGKESGLFAFDARDGKPCWQVKVPPVAGGAEVRVMEDTGYAAPTPVTDGRTVAAIFPDGRLVAVSEKEQALAWTRNLGVPDNMYGHASSLALYRNLLLVQWDQGSPDDGRSRLMALDMATGAVAWDVPRPGGASWASPVVVEPETQPRLIVAGYPWLMAYDPRNGRECWRAECLRGDVGPSPVAEQGMVYAVAQTAPMIAVHAGGTGDVTGTGLAWTYEDDLADTCSPLVSGDLVFMLASDGRLTCLERATGVRVWMQDLRMPCRASPTLCGDRLYVLGDDGTMVVCAAGREYRELARSRLGERTSASPACAGDLMVIRGASNLWGLAETGSGGGVP